MSEILEQAIEIERSWDSDASGGDEEDGRATDRRRGAGTAQWSGGRQGASRLQGKKIAEDKARARTLARAQAVAEKLSTATEQVASAITEATSAGRGTREDDADHRCRSGRGVRGGGRIARRDQPDRKGVGRRQYARQDR